MVRNSCLQCRRHRPRSDHPRPLACLRPQAWLQSSFPVALRMSLTWLASRSFSSSTNCLEDGCHLTEIPRLSKTCHLHLQVFSGPNSMPSMTSFSQAGVLALVFICLLELRASCSICARFDADSLTAFPRRTCWSTRFCRGLWHPTFSLLQVSLSNSIHQFC